MEHGKYSSLDSNQILLNDNDQQVFCMPGTKSAIYDCLVSTCYISRHIGV